MTLSSFVRQNRRAITDHVQSQTGGKGCAGNDDEREDWVLNDPVLYAWAQRKRVTSGGLPI